MKTNLVSMTALLLVCMGAIAQEQPNSAGYHARHNPSSPYYVGGNQQQAKTPQIRWADRWGAIASDGNGVFGIVSDLTSKRQAKEAALFECKKRGGGQCEVNSAYVNQCAAVIGGSTSSHTVNAETVERATEIGIKGCKADGNKECWVYYSGCSLPVQVN